MKIRYDLKAGHTWKGPQEEEVRIFLSFICNAKATNYPDEGVFSFLLFLVFILLRLVAPMWIHVFRSNYNTK